MERFQMTFFKNLTSSNGHNFKCVQGEVMIGDAASPRQALEAAEGQFARSKGVGDWTLRADVAELVCCDRAASRVIVHRARDTHRRGPQPT